MQFTDKEILRLSDWFDILERSRVFGPPEESEFPTEEDHLLVIKIVKMAGPQDDDPK